MIIKRLEYAKDKAKYNGLKKQQSIFSDYDSLIDFLGEPEEGGIDIKAEWVFEFPSGNIGSIYASCEDNTPIEDVLKWRIAAKNSEGYQEVIKLLMCNYKLTRVGIE